MYVPLVTTDGRPLLTTEGQPIVVWVEVAGEPAASVVSLHVPMSQSLSA